MPRTGINPEYAAFSQFISIQMFSRITGKEILRLPQSVEITVGIHSLHLIIRTDHKLCLRLLAWLQFLSLIALLGRKSNPLYVMLGKHGVLRGTNGDRYLLTIHLDNRDMLFNRCIRGIGLQFLHLFTAANNRDPAALYKCDYIAAMAANIKFIVLPLSLLYLTYISSLPQTLLFTR